MKVFVDSDGEASDLLAWSVEKHGAGRVKVTREPSPDAIRLKPPALVLDDPLPLLSAIRDGGSRPGVSRDIAATGTILLHYSRDPDEMHPSWDLWRAYRLGMLRERDGGTFDYAKRPLEYFFHPKNFTWKNERTVEVPIAMAALAKVSGDVLEVGDVLHQYGATRPRTIVDLGSSRGIQKDVLAYRGGPFDLIVTVSTLEHVGIEDGSRDSSRAIAAVKHLIGMLRPAGRLLLTIPVGYNLVLDGWLFSGWPGRNRYMLRVSKVNRWVECDDQLPRRAQYGSPFHAANALIIGEYLAPHGLDD